MRTRCAAMDSRFKACVAWGGIWDYHEVWQRRMSAAQELHLPVPGRHLPWNTTTSTPEEALAALEPFKSGRCGAAGHVPISPLPRGRRSADSLVGRAEAVRSGQLPRQNASSLYGRRGGRSALPSGQHLRCGTGHIRLDCRPLGRLVPGSIRSSRNASDTQVYRVQHCQCRVDNIQSLRAPHSEELAMVASIRGCRGDEIAG